jgi:hypothetical protein
MRSRLLLVPIFVLHFQGCAQIYVEPLEEPRAQIRFVSHTSGIANVLIDSYDAEDCKTGKARVAALTGIAVSHHRKKLGLPLGDEFDEKNYTETYIRANRPFIFKMIWGSGSAYTGYTICHVTTVFEPAENQMYEASYYLGEDNCRVVVTKLTRVGNRYIRVLESTARNSAMECKP